MTGVCKIVRLTLYGLIMFCLAGFLWLAIEGRRELAARVKDQRGDGHPDSQPRA